MKYLFFSLFFLIIFCACGLEKAKKTKFSPIQFNSWALRGKYSALINFAVDSQVVYCTKIPKGLIFLSRYKGVEKDCGCDFPELQISSQKANVYALIQAYQDSQRIHQDTFLHHCENTDALNQAFINANIKTSYYTKIELAAILKKWGEPTNQTINGDFDIEMISSNFDDTVLNSYFGDIIIRNNYFLTNYDTAFLRLQQQIRRWDCQKFIYAYAETKDSSLNMRICEQLRAKIQQIGENSILLVDYYPFYYYQERDKGLYYLENDTIDANYCLPNVIYQFDIYDKDGFVQVKKKILNGYNLFLQ